MIKSELLEKIKNAKEDEDINSLLAGTDIEETFKDEGATLDSFKEKIKSDKDFKSFMESENDKYHNKALKTWKENNLEKELEPLIKEKYPELVTDPTEKKLLALEKELEKERADNAKKDLLTEAVKYANEKGIKLSAIDKFLGDDLDTTKSNLDALADDWSKGIEAVVEQKMKVNSYIPGISGEGDEVSIGASLAVKANESKSAPSDPWA
ncbi:DUF4355 domain-containing protein [Clostridium botulinum]|uniref:DUF4355 domain-containing protein n=1 Tax=Clostridium botulinum TaxID=1491 RepID=UPI0013F13B15|nr:DUF4355 domain-containing protein [Clostridium botulinum]MCS6110383.1 DUF4355 domain-containing protein [Clostridium botulinum]NFE13124.1 DUF4355 domain-containing protein [Clostridium botulinum]NFL42216.1 DUF4355 domain-containing protein [Clostridium botulinum]NFN21449.1 DUF4355 domain-containing protein [Clostridium botulinum]NFN42660.1 DUF4355 domain-containing protein [Clostridium botulinum]